MKDIKVTVERRKGPQEEPYMEDFTVPLENGMSVLNVLDYINQHHDPGFAYEPSCRRGLCSVCMVEVDGRKFKSCLELCHGDMEIKPGSKHVIKDLAFATKKIKE